jgi:endonuclease/exonuclease/phosphatase family metal-dependent hydrolase
VTISAVRRRTAWVDLGCWLAVAVGGVLTLARWLGYDGGVWPLVLVPALTPYLVVVALVPVVACLIARRWLAASVAVALLAALVGFVAPRGFGAPDPARGPALRVLAANMKESAADPRSVVDIVRTAQVDVLAVSEVRRNELTGMARAGLTDLLPYSVANPGESTTGGTALYSRYPLTDGQRVPLTNGFIETAAVLHVPGSPPVHVTAVHYCAPADPTQMACWTYGMAQTPPATPDGPLRLLLGDFNLTVDYGALRTLLGTGYRDAASVVGRGFTTTWPYDGTPAPPVAIDHVLADRRIGVSGFAAYPIRRSDHRAVFAALTLPPG